MRACILNGQQVLDLCELVLNLWALHREQFVFVIDVFPKFLLRMILVLIYNVLWRLEETLLLRIKKLKSLFVIELFN